MFSIRSATRVGLILSLALALVGSAFGQDGAVRTTASHPLHVRMGARQVRPGYASTTGSTFQFIPGHGIAGESCDLPTSACDSGTRIYN